MPSNSTLERFIARVEENAHVGAIKEFYAPDASMQENNAPPRRGREVLVANEAKTLSRAKAVRSECIRPVFVSGDLVIVRWRFSFTWLDGTTSEIEELAYQRWQGEQVVEEQFFYDPAQFKPTPPTGSAGA